METWWEQTVDILREMMAATDRHVTLAAIRERLAELGVKGARGQVPTRQMVHLVLQSRDEWRKLWAENMARKGLGHRSRYAKPTGSG